MRNFEIGNPKPKLNSKTEEYLELEFGPHGHYLALRFKGERKGIDTDTKFEFWGQIEFYTFIVFLFQMTPVKVRV